MSDLASVLRELPDAVIVTSCSGEVLWANRAAEELLDDDVDRWLGRSMLDAVHPDDHLIAMNACASVGQKDVGGLLAVRIRRADGELVGVELRGRSVVWELEQAIVLVIRRVGDRGALELAGNDSTMLHRLVHHSPAILAMVDGDGTLLSVNAAITRCLGADPDVVCGNSILDLIDETDRRAIGDMIAHLDGDVVAGSVVMRTVDGERRWFEMRATDLRAEAAVGAIAVSMSDVTDLRSAERRLQRLADTDSLTGLLNRRAFEERLEPLLRDDAADVALLYVDIDGFKTINDTYGHHVGDAVLAATARRIDDISPVGSLTARVGGDEFIVAVTGSGRTDRQACRVAAKLSSRFVHDGISIVLSVGTSSSSRDPVASMIAEADRDMYRVKRRRRLESADARDAIRPRSAATSDVHVVGLVPDRRGA